MNKISIIIPVYNKEKWISKCLDSILEQDYVNYEVILIDDCSTDNSYKICEKYTDNKKIILIKTEKNSGPGVARNMGLKIATGDYITYIDADDYIDNKYLSTLIKNMNNSCDMVVSGWIELRNRYKKMYKTTDCIIRSNMLAEYIFSKDHIDYFLGPVCTLYRMDVIRNKNIIFENCSYGEDTIFNFNYLKYCNAIRMIEYAGYTNRIINGTLSRGKIVNLWKCLDLMDAAAQNTFNYHYDHNWSFFYFRSCKIALNQADDKKAFIMTCEKLINNKFYNIHSNKLDKKDKIIYYLLRNKKYNILFIFTWLLHKLREYKNNDR